jgi:hypothetical protein
MSDQSGHMQDGTYRSLYAATGHGARNAPLVQNNLLSHELGQVGRSANITPSASRRMGRDISCHKYTSWIQTDGVNTGEYES